MAGAWSLPSEVARRVFSPTAAVHAGWQCMARRFYVISLCIKRIRTGQRGPHCPSAAALKRTARCRACSFRGGEGRKRRIVPRTASMHQMLSTQQRLVEHQSKPLPCVRRPPSAPQSTHGVARLVHLRCHVNPTARICTDPSSCSF